MTRCYENTMHIVGSFSISQWPPRTLRYSWSPSSIPSRPLSLFVVHWHMWLLFWPRYKSKTPGSNPSLDNIHPQLTILTISRTSTGYNPQLNSLNGKFLHKTKILLFKTFSISMLPEVGSINFFS